MRETRKVYAPLSMEYLFSEIFGSQTYHDFVGEHSFGKWKKEVLKLLKAIKKYILINLDTTDGLHKADLLMLCDQYEIDLKESKTIDQINLLAIEFLVKSNLMLMGMMPKHFFRNKVNRNEHYRLDRRRKVVYLQSNQQKVLTIFDLTDDYRYAGKLPEYNRLTSVFNKDYKRDSGKFIDWFKREYPEIYLEVF